MAFSNFTDRLPDPNWTIHDSGEGHASNYTAGPGFASVDFASEQPVSISRTNSGRVMSRAIVGQRWKIKISYNPMTRAQFEPVYNFLLEKRGRLKPFFITLPQHTPRSATSSTPAASTALIVKLTFEPAPPNAKFGVISTGAAGVIISGPLSPTIIPSPPLA